MPATELAGRVAIVTGASAGIGAAIARDLASAGMRVVAAARRTERLTALADEVAAAGGQLRAERLDLRDEAQIVDLFARTADWGPVWTLINNAGLGRQAGLLDGETDAWREMLEVNVLGLLIATREAVARMADDRGHVIHVGSMSGHRVPGGGGAVYSATKFAVRALTEGLRQELRGRGSAIRVGCVSPGSAQTEFHEVYLGSKDAAAQTYGRFKVLEAADVARAVRQLLEAPEHVQIHDVLMRPTDQPS